MWAGPAMDRVQGFAVLKGTLCPGSSNSSEKQGFSSPFSWEREKQLRERLCKLLAFSGAGCGVAGPSHNPPLAPRPRPPGDALSEAPGPQRTRQVLDGLLLEFPVAPWLEIVYPDHTDADSSPVHFYEEMTRAGSIFADHAAILESCL